MVRPSRGDRLGFSQAAPPGAVSSLRCDVVLYGGSAVFAAGLSATSTLAPHRIWGYVATTGYVGAAVVASAQVAAVRRGARRGTGPAARAAVATVTCLATVVLPLLLLVTGRASGQVDLALDEVRVVEEAGRRLLDTGTLYLDRAAIASLSPGEQLAAYIPYNPGMALFGVPRALDAASAPWSDARIWFAVAAHVVLGGALAVLRDALAGARVRAWQAATLAPPVALATAVGGDDVPVLMLCLLALALAARNRYGGAGLAGGAACALKLIAWPVAIVLLAHAATRGRATLGRYGFGMIGVAVPALLPTVLGDLRAMVENTVLFPLGAGLVTSPAQSPLPGHLIATRLPGGQALALALLFAAGLAVGVRLLRHPPRTAAAAATVSGYALLVASALMPATRFGYLLYPLALLAWVPALRTTGGRQS
jgi:hypothetical protein